MKINERFTKSGTQHTLVTSKLFPIFRLQSDVTQVSAEGRVDEYNIYSGEQNLSFKSLSLQ